jgi:hypothetical protein
MTFKFFAIIALVGLFASGLAAPPPKQHSSLLNVQHMKTSNAMGKELSQLHPHLPTKEHLLSTRPHGRHFVHEEGIAASTASGQTVVVPTEDWWQWALITNITAGIPAQPMRVAISFWTTDLQLLAANATMHFGSSLDNKNVYNASASITSSTNNANFSSEYYNSGVVVSDIININGLLSNVSFGSLSDVNDQGLLNMPIDGYLGLAPATSNNNITNVLQQLAPSLDQPLMNIRIQRFYDDDEGVKTSAQIGFGSAQLSQCQSNGNAPKLGLNLAQSSGMPPTLNVSSIAIANANLSDTCATNMIQTAHPIMISPYYYPTLMSYQLEQLFVSASGAVFNETSGWYQVDCSQVANASPVNINLADGNTFVLQPNDYILQKDGQCYLYTWGYYDENDSYYADWVLVLGQQWLNNHCLSYNIQDNTLTISDATN